MGIPLVFIFLPFVTLMKPLMIIALGVTLILTGLACSYIAMSLVKKHTDMAIAFITAVFIAFSSPGRRKCYKYCCNECNSHVRMLLNK